jgi:hypothetical protein
METFHLIVKLQMQGEPGIGNTGTNTGGANVDSDKYLAVHGVTAELLIRVSNIANEADKNKCRRVVHGLLPLARRVRISLVGAGARGGR